LLTVSCDGEASDNNFTDEFLIPANTYNDNCKITPHTNEIVSIGRMVWRTDNTLSQPKLYNLSHGGVALYEHTDAEIVDNVELFHADLYILAHIANDYARYTLAQFEAKARLFITTAQQYGSVLLLGTGGNEDSASDDGVYETWKALFHSLSREYDCAYVDIDTYWGGFTAGNAAGMYDDTIHPSQIGHDSMANVLSGVLFKKPCEFYRYRVYKARPNYLEIQDLRNLHITGDVVLNSDAQIYAPNNNGVQSARGIQPIIAVPLAQFPNDTPVGTLGFDTGTEKTYKCVTAAVKEGGTVTTPCVYKDINSSLFASVSLTPGSIAAGASYLSDAVTDITGLLIGYFTAFVVPPDNPAGLIITAQVGGAGWAKISIFNPTAGALTAPAGTYKLKFMPY
jgi:hypothetical protein